MPKSFTVSMFMYTSIVCVSLGRALARHFLIKDQFLCLPGWPRMCLAVGGVTAGEFCHLLNGGTELMSITHCDEFLNAGQCEHQLVARCLCGDSKADPFL